MKIDIKKALAFVGSAVFSFFALDFFTKRRSGNYSNFSGGNRIYLKLKNTTASPKVVTLFGAWQTGSPAPKGVSVSGSSSLNYINQSLSSKPIKIKAIEIRVFGGGGSSTPPPSTPSAPVSVPPPAPPAPPVPPPVIPPVAPPVIPPVIPPVAPVVSSVDGEDQIMKPFYVQCKNASGQAMNDYIFPQPSAYQNQPNMATIEPDMVADGQCYMTYSLAPYADVALTIYYEEVDKVKEAKKEARKEAKKKRKKKSRKES